MGDIDAKDSGTEQVTLYPCQGFSGFQKPNHIYLARPGLEREGGRQNPLIGKFTMDEAIAMFGEVNLQVSESHTICDECRQETRAFVKRTLAEHSGEGN